jgi:hypothetical protein
MLEYNVWYRPLWDWCQELVLDRQLFPEFTWHAMRYYQFNGNKFVRFIDEPWTADAWWKFQVMLPSRYIINVFQY